MEPVATSKQTMKELCVMARDLGIKPSKLRKQELIDMINNISRSNACSIEMKRTPDEINANDTVSHKELRTKAKNLGIKDWWKKSKVKLENEIYQEEIR